MGFVLFGIFAVMELGLLIWTLIKQGRKGDWLRNSTAVRAAETAVFLLVVLLSEGGISFRFKICLLVLFLRLAVTLVFWLRKRKKGLDQKSKLGAAVSTCMGILVLGISLTPAFLFTGYAGLPTTGEYEVKQASAILVDESRIETFESDGSFREVPVYFYYPDTENTGAELFPLVLFSHGAFGYYQSNTSTYMELASHGYVVVSMDYPYHSFFTKDSDGKLITVNPEFLNEVMRVDSDEAAPEEVMELSHKWLDIRTADMGFVLDSLEDGAVPSDVCTILANADLEQIGLMGHSLGGAASVQLGRDREDIDAVIDIDGTMLGEQLAFENGAYKYNEAPYPVPILALDNEEHHQVNMEQREAYTNWYVLEHAKDGMETWIAGSEHMNFTDLPLFSPILAAKLGTGSRDARECVEIMNEVVLQYFDHYLKGKGALNIKESY